MSFSFNADARPVISHLLGVKAPSLILCLIHPNADKAAPLRTREDAWALTKAQRNSWLLWRSYPSSHRLVGQWATALHSSLVANRCCWESWRTITPLYITPISRRRGADSRQMKIIKMAFGEKKQKKKRGLKMSWQTLTSRKGYNNERNSSYPDSRMSAEWRRKRFTNEEKRFWDEGRLDDASQYLAKKREREKTRQQKPGWRCSPEKASVFLLEKANQSNMLDVIWTLIAGHRLHTVRRLRTK